MNLFLIRHGEFVGNVVPHDVPDDYLTDNGLDQARRLAAHMQGQNLTHIVASPLLRGLQTASEVAATSGLRFSVWKPLYEHRTKGPFTGPPLAKLTQLYPLADFDTTMEPEGWYCPGRESAEGVVARANEVRDRLKATFRPDDRVAVVAHAGLNSVLLGVLLGLRDPHAVKFRQKNCSYNHLVLGQEGIEVKSINFTSHLEHERTDVGAA